jgi:hypothetical protein
MRAKISLEDEVSPLTAFINLVSELETVVILMSVAPSFDSSQCSLVSILKVFVPTVGTRSVVESVRLISSRLPLHFVRVLTV